MNDFQAEKKLVLEYYAALDQAEGPAITEVLQRYLDEPYIWRGFHPFNEKTAAAAVAEFYGVSAAHIAKVVHQLARLGLIRSIRGVGGGIELARAPKDVVIGEVIAAFEGNLHLLECVSVDGVCAIEKFCKLKRVLSEAERVQLEYLNGVTLADVLPTRRQVAQVAPS